MPRLPPPQADWRGRRVLVTGAGGFIGRHLCTALTQAGASLYCVSRRVERGAAGPDERWYQADLGDRRATREVFEEASPEVVFHLASRVTGSRQRDLVLPTLRANLMSSVHVFAAASESGCRRLVHAGSMEEPAFGTPVGAPQSPYAAAKMAATLYGQLFGRLYDLPIVFARIFMVYGPGRQDYEKLVPYVVRGLLAQREIQISSGGRALDWVHVEDVVTGLLALGAVAGLEGRQLDIGSGRMTTIGEVVRQLYRHCGADADPPFGTLPDRPGEPSPCADVAATEKATGWRPEISLETGLAETVEWFRTDHHGPADRGPRRARSKP